MDKDFDAIFGPGPEPVKILPPELHQKAHQRAGKPGTARKGGGTKPTTNGHASGAADTGAIEAIEASAQANAREAVAFLKALDPTGWHALAVISPRTGKPPEVKTFAPGSWARNPVLRPTRASCRRCRAASGTVPSP